MIESEQVPDLSHEAEVLDRARFTRLNAELSTEAGQPPRTVPHEHDLVAKANPSDVSGELTGQRTARRRTVRRGTPRDCAGEVTWQATDQDLHAASPISL